jgi:hypothetical protein
VITLISGGRRPALAMRAKGDKRAPV